MSNDFEIFIKNVKYFLETIIRSAQCDGSWCEFSIERGIGWAKFCEESIKEPDLEIALVNYLENNHIEYFSVEDIKFSRKLLLSTLMLNQLLSKDCIRIVVKISVEQFGESATNKLVKQCTDIIDSYKTVVKLLRTDHVNIFNRIKALLLIEAISNKSLPKSALCKVIQRNGSLSALLELCDSLNERKSTCLLLCLGEYFKKEMEDYNNAFILHQFASLSQSKLSFLCEKIPKLHSEILFFLKMSVETMARNFYADVSENEIFKSISCIYLKFISCPLLSAFSKTYISSLLISKEAYIWHKIILGTVSNCKM